MKKLFIVTTLTALVAAAGFAGQLIPAKGQPVPGDYVVVLNPGFPAAEVLGDLAAAHGGVAARTYRHALNGGLIRGLSAARAQALANHPMVAVVEEDGVVEAVAVQLNPPSWGLDRIDQRALPLDNSYTYNFDGTGVDVYVIDTGLRATHNDFGGRATLDFDSIGDGQNGNDCHGHGTHVGGTAGGTSFGVAKNVRLHAVRVLNCSGSGTFAGVIAGVDFVTGEANANPNGLLVANMSLGGGASSTLDSAVNNSVAAGVVYALAAGNSNADACNSSPARAADAYTVGSTTITDARSSFSNFGTCLDIFAPGSSITSAWNTSDTATNTISGTSMASPHAAGAAALVRDEFPAMDAFQVMDELTRRATCGVVGNPGNGSPNLLLYTLNDTDPNCDGGGDPPPTCLAKGAACTTDSQCCSNKCKGPNGNKSCK